MFDSFIGLEGEKLKKIKDFAGEGAVLLAAIMWGCIGLLTRPLTENGFSAIETVAGRALFTTLFMFLIVLFICPKLLKIKLRDLWIFVGTGIFSFLFFNICYMSSMAENSLSVACILMYTSPFWILTLSVPIFKERMTYQKGIALIIAFVGCVLVCTSASLRLTGIGLVYGLLSGFGYALYTIFGKLAAGRYSQFTTVFYTFLFATIGALPFCNISSLSMRIVSGNNIWLVLGIALANTVFPYLLYTYGLAHTTSGKAAILSIIEPVVAAVVGVLFFSEYMGFSGVFGIVLVVLGLVILEIKPKNR
jgi:drug/metabolite transporter (DMT)-like permease